MIHKIAYVLLGSLCLVLSLFFKDGQWLDFQKEVNSLIFWEVRLPRLLLCFVCGIALSMGGLIFQSLFRNDLASPYTLGVASGASLGASLFIWAGLSISFEWAGIIFDTLFLGAFLGAILCVSIILGLSRLRNNKSIDFLILAGVMMSFVFSSAIMLVQYLSSQLGLQKMIYWLMGDLSIIGFDSLYLLYPVALVVTAYIYQKRDLLNILSMGDHFARSKGINPSGQRRRLFFITSTLIALVVSICGPIGFVGLIIPHIMKRKYGSNLKRCLVPTLLGGGFFLIGCDFLARNLFLNEIPIGVVTSLIGGVFFLFLLMKKTSHN